MSTRSHSRDAVAARLVAERLLAIVRTDRPDDALAAIDGFAQAGVGLAEVSLSAPTALDALRGCAEAHGDAIVLGAGTVRTVAQAEAALAAGARFLVSPSFDRGVHDCARERDVLYLPGVLTPTEVDVALQAGADLLKLFPVGAFGPRYVRDLLAPFPGARFVATGGVSADDAAAYLDAGAVAVALGSSLLPADTDGGALSAVAVADATRRVRLALA